MKMINPIEIDFLPDNLYLGPIVQGLTDLFHLPHIVGPVNIGALPPSSTRPDGTAWFGAGNLTTNELKLFDHTSGALMAFKGGYRTGDYVDPVKIGNDWVETMKAGLQDGTHGEQGSRTDRSGAKVDLTITDPNGFHDGQYTFTVNNHDMVLAHTTPTNWFFKDAITGTPVQGLTLSPDGHTLTDSNDFAFDAAYLQHGTNPADISPQTFNISLTENVGTVGVAKLSEVIHLV